MTGGGNSKILYVYPYFGKILILIDILQILVVSSQMTNEKV